MPFDDAVELIADAYGSVQSRNGRIRTDDAAQPVDRRHREFAQTTRVPTAPASRSRARPRVYMTYHGTTSDIITLAHELGHAFHSWVMRDLPDSQRSYGMSLAETASTFGETTVRDALLRARENPARTLRDHVGGDDAISAFMLNIPARFSFEKAFYERARRTPAARRRTRSADERRRGRTGTANACSEPDPMFWAIEAALLHLGSVVLQLPVSVRVSVQHGRVPAPRRTAVPSSIRATSRCCAIPAG